MDFKNIYKIVFALFFFTQLLSSSIQAQDDFNENWNYIEASSDFQIDIERFKANPIIHREMAGMIGDVGENINGPSLIRVPDWVDEYFGDTVPLVSGHIVPLSMSDISG